MKLPILVLALAMLALGFALSRTVEHVGASNRTSSPGPVARVPGAAPPPTLAPQGWQEALRQEREAREALALEVTRLQLELEALRTEASPPDDLAEPGAEGESAEERAVRGAADPDRPWFDDQRLLLAGLSRDESDRLREVFEEVEMERLRIRDQAQRESWGWRRRREAERELDTQLLGLRDDVGEPTYDWFLYAANRNNRVFVRDVLRTSPAGEAGVRAGDEITSYAGARIYDAEDLRRATTEGQAGETVAVIVTRNGSPLTLRIPRGPLGVRLEPRVMEPGRRP